MAEQLEYYKVKIRIKLTALWTSLKMKFFQASLFLLLITYNFSFPQNLDTLLVTSKNLKVSNLKEGKSSYLVYFKKDKEAPISDIQIWNLEIKNEDYDGKKAITIYQKWYYKDTIVHTAKSVSLTENFKPLYHESWWKERGKKFFDVTQNKLSIDDVEISSSETNPKNKSVYDSFTSSQNQYFLNWHLDLEVFSMLPYKKNVTYLVPFYEFGYDIPRNIAYTVYGEDIIMYNGEKIKCWLLKHEEEDNKETFWISKKTKEVLKMEQIINDKMYRYKYKLQY